MTLLLPFGSQPQTFEDLLFGLEQDDGLRWYQREAIVAANAGLESSRSALLVLATGLGKSVIQSQMAAEFEGPQLFLSHREELIQQMREHLERRVGESVDVERAQDQAGFRARFVVGSVQSVCQKKRLERMGHERFARIYVDEAHHTPASSYRRILDWFGPARYLGFTATPDRGDEKAMGSVYDTVAYVFDIEQGIEDGFLVPIRGQHVDVADVSRVQSSKGDLAEGELDEAMLKAVAGIVHETLRLEPDRKGIAFWPGVRSSQLAAETFNRLKPGCAAHVDANTPKEERALINADFKRGKYQYYNNVGIATEGWDCPDVSLVIHGRPTKSRALFSQMSGRGTRVLPGLIDHLRGKSDGPARRALVAGSGKPDLMMLDFVANAGRHDLVTPEDLLGGSYSDEEVALAKKKRGGGGSVRDELEKARAELQRMAEAAKRRQVTSNVSSFDPFRALGLNVSESNRYGRFGKPVPEWLKQALTDKGVSKEEAGKLNARSAFLLFNEMKQRQNAGLCTYKQARWLERYGVTAKDVSFDRAAQALDYIFGQRNAGRTVEGPHLDMLVHSQRQPGED